MRSCLLVGPRTTSPVSILNLEPCQGQVRTPFSSSPSTKGAPAWVQRASKQKNFVFRLITSISFPLSVNRFSSFSGTSSALHKKYRVITISLPEFISLVSKIAPFVFRHIRKQPKQILRDSRSTAPRKLGYQYKGGSALKAFQTVLRVLQSNLEGLMPC
jgi:hypothetical protein